LSLLRNAPSDVRVIDHIEYDDAPVGTSGSGDEGAHPVPELGHGAIHVVTDVIGASAILRGQRAGIEQVRHAVQLQQSCSRAVQPGSAEGRLSIRSDGVAGKEGDVQDQKIKLESLAKGIFISSKPPGADVFINGAKQSGQTPVTLPLAPDNTIWCCGCPVTKHMPGHPDQRQHPDATRRDIE